MTVDRAPFGSPTRALPLLLCGAALVGALSAPGSAATAAPPAFATLTGRLVVPRGTLDPRGVTLEVGAYLAEDTAAGEDSVPSSSPSPPRKPTVTLRPDGRFRLSSLAPGTARLTVRVPGYVEERVADIELVAGRTTKLRAPVLLRPGFDLEVTVEPPRDWEGRPWRVRASKRAEAAGPLPCDGGAVLAETEEARPAGIS